MLSELHLLRILSCGGRNIEERTLCWSWNLQNKAKTNSVLRPYTLGCSFIVS